MKKLLLSTLIALTLATPVLAQTNVSQGGTGTTTFAAGGLVIGSSTLRLSSSPLKLFWDWANNRLGVGTNTPTDTFSVDGTALFYGTLKLPLLSAGCLELSGGAVTSTGSACGSGGGGITNAYASSTFPSFGYASSTFVTYPYGTSTYLAIIGNQVAAGNKTFTGNTILSNASSTNLSLSGLFYDSIASPGSLGKVLWSTGTSTLWVSTSTLGISGSGGTPGGSDTQVQFNDGGTFGGDTGFTWDKTSNILTIGLENALGTLKSASAVSANTNGGTLYFAGGDGLGSGNGGTFLIQGGSGGVTDGSGGDVSISGGTKGGVGNNGDIYLGTPGRVYIVNTAGTASALLSVTSLSGGGKTFTFPNISGTFALGSGSTGNCAQWSSANVLTDTGSACGSGGGGSFSTTSINGFATTTFSFLTGTAGSDFNIATSTTDVTFNIPTASASNRGLLSTTDWSTFNNKVSNVYASATFPSFTYATSTFVPFGYASTTFPTFTYGTSTYAPIATTVTYTYASSTFPSFTYATNTFMTYAYGTSTFPSFTYATATYVAIIGNQTIAGNKTFTGTSTLATTTISRLSLTGGFLDSLGGIGAAGQALFSNGTSTLWTSAVTNTYATATFSTYAYGTSTYYFASNPSNYITLASLSGTYPIIYNSGTGAISTGFSTSTTNTYSGVNTFNATSTFATTTTNGSSTFVGQVYMGNASSSGLTATNLYSTLANLTKGIFTNASTTNFSLSGLFYDSVNATGTNGQILTSTGTSTLWTAASGGISNAYASSTFPSFIYATATFPSFTYGTSTYVNYTYATNTYALQTSFSGTNGFVPRWTSASALGTGIIRDNGTVAGIGATSSTILFNITGTSGSTNTIFNVASSSGAIAAFLSILPSGNVLMGTSSELSSNKEKLRLDCGLANEDCIGEYGSTDDFFQHTITNMSQGINTEAGYTAQNASSTATTNYAWYGINGPRYATSTTYSTGWKNDVTLIAAGNDFHIANASTTGKIFFMTGGLSTSTNARATLDSVGSFGVGTTSPAARFALTAGLGASIPMFMVASSSDSPVFTIAASGSAAFKATATSTLAFTISNPSNSSVFTVNTTPPGLTDFLFNVATSSNDYFFGVKGNGHLTASSTAPTLSSCGTSPSIRGTDTAGEVQVGSVSATGCTITFANAWTNSPSCIIVNQTGSVTNTFSYTISTTAITVTETGLTSAKLDYHCIGIGE